MEDDKEPVYASKAKPWLKYYDEKYIHQSVPECSAFALVCRSNERHLGDTALEYYGRKFSYADLIVQIKKTAAALQALGVKKGDIITVVSVMTPEVVYTFYAADLLGATLNLVDPRYSAEGIREYIQEVESRLLICLNVVYPRCHQAAKRTSVERVVVLSPADSLPLAKAVGYKLTEPVPVTATGGVPIKALSGVNTVLTDADNVTVTGRADPIKRITDLEAAVASIN